MAQYTLVSSALWVKGLLFTSSQLGTSRSVSQIEIRVADLDTKDTINDYIETRKLDFQIGYVA